MRSTVVPVVPSLLWAPASGAPESQESSEGRVTVLPGSFRHLPSVLRSGRNCVTGTWPCLSPAGTVTGRSCHLDPGCPGSHETLRHGEEGVGARGPGQTPGHPCRTQRPDIAVACCCCHPPPPPPCDSVSTYSCDQCGLPRVATRPGHRACAPLRTPFLSSLIGVIARCGGSGRTAQAVAGGSGAFVLGSPGGGRWGPMWERLGLCTRPSPSVRTGVGAVPASCPHRPRGRLHWGLSPGPSAPSSEEAPFPPLPWTM